MWIGLNRVQEILNIDNLQRRILCYFEDGFITTTCCRSSSRQMRARTLSNVLTLVTAGSLVAASPISHKHHKHSERLEARSPDNVKTVSVPGPTVVAYELNGQLVDKEEVCAGIKNGSLKWSEDSKSSLECSTDQQIPLPSTPIALARAVDPSAVPTTIPSQASTPATQDSVEQKQAFSPSVASSFGTTTEVLRSQSTTSASSSPFSNQGLDKVFPDGAIDCSTFPSEYGPIQVDWARLGGWTGIQYVTIQGNSITHVDTAIPGGQGCKPGAMCSYACPAGYQKSQWPSAQGSTGQSIGGLQCNENGKLSLTNPSLSRRLCIKGTGATTVQNKLSNNAAICRTDYPGMLPLFRVQSED